MSYYVLALSGRRLLALPSINSETVALSARGLNSQTAKRRVFAASLAALFLTRIIQNKLERSASPLVGDNGTLWEHIMSHVCSAVGTNIERHVVYYPNQKERKRAYLYVPRVLSGGDLFVKVEYGSEKDKLQNEMRFLSMMSKANVAFSLPEVVGSAFEEGFGILLLRAFPHEFRQKAMRWDSRPFSLRNEIIGPVQMKDIHQLGWWSIFVRRPLADQYGLRELISRRITNGHPVGIAHGDFASGNIFYHDRQTIVADWELASVEAPFMLDELCYRMSLEQRRIHVDPAGALDVLMRETTASCDRQLAAERLDSLLLSLAYLISENSLEATLLARCANRDSILSAYELSR